MANVAVTNNFSAGTKAQAGQVNTNFADLTTWLNNRNGGSDTWGYMLVSATVANPAEIKSSASSAELDIDCTGTNGTPLLTWRRSGTTYFTAGVDGAASNIFKIGTTALTSNVAMQIPSAGSQVQFAAGSVAAPSISIIGEADSGIFKGGTGQLNMAIDGGSIMYWTAAEVKVFQPFKPNGAGSLSSGDGTDYWNDISYKTLTDRGCLPWADEGVELQDGSIVSDCEALSSIKKHPTKLTVHGLPMLDYSTFPKVSYKKEEKGDDGVEMTSMFGFMIGAIKELHNRVKGLEDGKHS